MKKIILTFFTTFILFLLVFSTKEISDFQNIYRANTMYIQNNLTWAIDIYDQINENVISDTNREILNFLKWNTLYKQWKYFEALKEYNKSSFRDNKKLEFYKRNAVWNIDYRLWELWNNDDKLKHRQEALYQYKNTINLDINENKKNTLYNYNLVKNKLDELKKKLEQEQKKKEEEKQKEQQKQEEKQNKQTNSWSSNKQDDKKTSSWSEDSTKKESQQNISWKQWRNWWEFNSIWNSNSWSKDSTKLTPEEKKELDNYSNSLKDFQKNNWQYLQRWEQKKPDTSDIFNRMMNEFKSDPFFKDVIPQYNIDKDW